MKDSPHNANELANTKGHPNYHRADISCVPNESSVKEQEDYSSGIRFVHANARSFNIDHLPKEKFEFIQKLLENWLFGVLGIKEMKD
ncbi:MAG: hypothetical protein H6606_02835 [Flavobacteriales bacterium]|nr:hypothetical protein [Flavobacteriales bacterium]